MNASILLKHHRKTFTLAFLVLTLAACKEEAQYRMQILLRNERADTLRVDLYAKPAWLLSGMEHLYQNTDLGNGGYVERSVELAPEESHTLFLTADLGQEPAALALKVFDSVYIFHAGADTALMKFYPDRAKGFPHNLFDAGHVWDFEQRHYDEPTQFKQNPVTSYDYTFVISE